MEFRILGSLEIWDGPSQIEIGGTKRRALLALLLLHANEIVGKDRLVDELWGEEAPRTAAASLHNHISRLRKALGPDRLGTRAWGYVLRVEPKEVDLQRFERLIGEAEPLPAKERSAKLAEALALWRGPALADLAFEQALAKEVARLEELRLAALETRIDADLEIGRSAGIIAELEVLIAEHPLRERLRGQLILALYRDGRQAEALEVYRETRRLLADELGLEPSPALRELERAILRQDPTLALSVRAQEPPDVERAPSRWRWPRSPLVAVAAVLLLAGGGVATAIVATRGGGSHHKNALAASLALLPSLPQIPSYTPKTEPAPPTTSDVKPAAATARTSQGPSTRSQARQTLAAVRVRSVRAHPGRARVKQRAGRSGKPGSRTRSKHAKPAKVYWLADDFTDPAFSSSMWNLSGQGTGVEVSEANGQLQFSIAPDVVYDQRVDAVGQHYGTNCYLTGNFDADIEFKLLSWPRDDGVLVSFGMYFPPPHEAFWSISRLGASGIRASEGYLARLGGRDQWTPTAEASGALRLRRKDGLLVGYYRQRRHWVKLDSSKYASGPASLIVMFAAHPGEFGGQAATATIDNFEATATSVDCPPGTPLPPRRAPR